MCLKHFTSKRGALGVILSSFHSSEFRKGDSKKVTTPPPDVGAGKGGGGGVGKDG